MKAVLARLNAREQQILRDPSQTREIPALCSRGPLLVHGLPSTTVFCLKCAYDTKTESISALQARRAKCRKMQIVGLLRPLRLKPKR